MLKFHSLRTRLTVLYAGLFALAMLLLSAAVYLAIANNAASQVRGELTASGTVFDRIWAMRTAQLENSAGLLSRDFGFRTAIASGDKATVVSALENLKVRLGIDLAFMVGPDGRTIGSDAGKAPISGPALAALQGDDPTAGVLTIGDTPYEAVSAPVLAPMPIGWLVFANRLDQSQMRGLEQLSAIPLDATVLAKGEHGQWRNDAGPKTPAGLGDFIEEELRATEAPRALLTAQGPAIALVKPLKAIADAEPAVLLLKYPMARAMAPYRLLLWAIIAANVAVVVWLVFGSWALARSVTRPLSALEEAARRLRRGEEAVVEVEGDDEIARLAEGFNAMAAEIGERERRITHLALHDAESGLPNRQGFERSLESLLAAEGGQLLVAAIGIDRYGHVRGAIGHDLAGAMIGEIGARMSALRCDASVACLSAGVLGVAFRASDETEARRAIEALQAAAEQPIRLGGTTIDVGLTAGMALYVEEADRPSWVIERAHVALDQARERYTKFAFFDAKAYGDPAANLSLMGEMRRSISEGGLVLHHQPKYDLCLGVVVGVECLVRWNHPKRGLVGPDQFVPMAEETGHIRALTEWVLASALAEQRQMRQAGYELSVSINISGRLLGDHEFVDAALGLVAGASGPVGFEITETAVIENPEQGLAVTEQLAAAGIAISIDDYGTGLSSLAYLKQIKASELKIDKSFVLSLADNQRDAFLVRSTIDLAHGLGLKVTAEGVETGAALERLAHLGCDLAQGYFIARPMPLNQLLSFMAQERATARTYG